MKLLAITFLLLIALTLILALRGVTGGKSPRRTAQALTLRVALSFALFLLLMLGGLLGWWQPSLS